MRPIPNFNKLDMKNKYVNLSSALLFMLIIFISCDNLNYALIEDVPLNQMELPQIEITDINTITQSSAQVYAEIESDGGGRITVSGVCWSDSNAEPTIQDNNTTNGFTDGEFRSFVKDLSYNTTYYVRAYATNPKGTKYSDVKQFITTSPLVVINTISVSEVTRTSALIEAVINEYGETASSIGVCWSTSELPTINDNKTTETANAKSFSSLLTELIPGTPYFARAYAVNPAGVAYGETITFTTKSPLIKDFDGNEYTSVKIGTQTWMVENLKVKHYRNGDPIEKVTQPSDWDSESGRYGEYDNNEMVSAIAGNLYNWYAAADPRNIAPEGWRVPTDADWTTLITHLGGENVAGGKLKSTNPQYWQQPNTGATNSSGFSAVGGGQAGITYLGGNLFIVGIYWTSSDVNPTVGLLRILQFDNSAAVYSGGNKRSGFSVRLVKDE